MCGVLCATGLPLHERTAVLVSFLLLLQNALTKNLEKAGFILARDPSYRPRVWGTSRHELDAAGHTHSQQHRKNRAYMLSCAQRLLYTFVV